MLTKPCARADRGCQNLVRARRPSEFRRRVYCSKACQVAGQRESSHANIFSREGAQRAGKLGGAKSGAVRHKLALTQAAAVAWQAIPAKLRDSLTASQQAMVLVAMGKACQRAYALGRLRDWRARAKERRAA